MNKLPRLLVLMICVAGVSYFPMMRAIARAESEQTIEMSSERSLARAEELDQQVIEFYQQGRYTEAIPLAQASLDIREKIMGSEHLSLGIILNNLAVLYYRASQYEKALSLFERSLSIHESTLSPDHPNVVASLNNLLWLNQIQGNYEEALSLFERSLSILESDYDIRSSHVKTSLTIIALSYGTQAQYVEALPLFDRALSIVEIAFDSSHPNIDDNLAIIKNIYPNQDNAIEVLPLFYSALPIFRPALDPDYTYTLASANLLTSLFNDQGYQNYVEEALPLYERALSIFETILDPEHFSYFHILPNLTILAALHAFQGEDMVAISLYERSLPIVEAVFGTDHSYVASSLRLLADRYREQGTYQKALELYERSLSIYDSTPGQGYPDIVDSLNKLAFLYEYEGNYAESLDVYERVLSIEEETLSSEAPAIARTLNKIAFLSVSQGEVDVATNLFDRARGIEEQNLVNALSSSIEKIRQNYINRLSAETETSISFNINNTPTNSISTEIALATILRRKGRVLDATAHAVQQLRQNLTPENQYLFNELNDVRAQITNLHFSDLGARTIQQYQTELSELESSAEELERQLALNSQEFQVASEPINVEIVKALVPTNAALVEFMHYRRVDFDNPQLPWRKPHYAAYILTHSGQIQIVDLGEATAIDQSVAEFTQALKDKSNNVKTIGRQLDQQLMAPIRKLVGNKSHLLISPDSTLNLIPFEALVDDQERYLVETYQISYLTSGRDLLKQSLNTASQQDPVVIANPDYTTATTQIASTPAVNASVSRETSRNQRSVDANSLDNFAPLPGTKTEAEAIVPLLPNATLFTEQQATENILKQVNAPSILHIATHGFFLPDVEFITPAEPNTRHGAPTVEVQVLDQTPTAPIAPSNLENPLLRSGLALAGANTRSSHGEDGIFTALEAASLNLYGTRLVVLSACETGLGSVSNGEGVYGLRRAFTIAGAESQLMSLWQVDDEGTSTLMQQYYKNLMQQGQGRSEALRNAQIELLDTGTYAHPYYWSSFIFSGDWRPLNE